MKKCQLLDLYLGQVMRVQSHLVQVWQDESGATAIEYGLILALIGLAMFGMLQAVAGETIEMWTEVETEVLASNIVVPAD